MKHLLIILAFVSGGFFQLQAQTKITPEYAIIELSEWESKKTLIIFYPDGKEEDYGVGLGINLERRGTHTSMVLKAMNYLASKGYEYVNAHNTIISNGWMVTNYVFKKE